MPDLPGHEFRPRIQEIPEYADAEKLAADMRDGNAMRPGEIRYARTGGGERVPSPYVVENSCFVLSVEQCGEPDENGEVELHTTMLTDLNPQQVLEVLLRTACEVIEICEHGKASRN